MEKVITRKKVGKIKSQNSSARNTNIDKDNMREEYLKKDELNMSTNKDNNRKWRCAVVVVICQTQRICNIFHSLKDLPDNFTVITKESLTQFSREGNTTNKSRKSSKSGKRSTSKISDRSNKTKVQNLKSRKKSKEPVPTFTADDKSINSDSSWEETSVLLQKCISSLKNKDTMRDVQSQRHIILSGFYNTNVLEDLIRTGIPVRALIYIKEINYDKVIKIDNENKTFKKENKTVDKTMDDYNSFLSEMSKKISEIKYLESNKDMLILNYTISTNSTEETFRLNLLNMMGYIEQTWESFERYCDTIEVIDVPIDEPIQLENACLYTTLIAMVPAESVNIPIVLHCMLEQVVWWSDEEYLSKEDNLFNSRDLNNQKNLVSNKVVENITPILVEESNEMRLNTFHLDLPEFNFEDISTNILTKSPIYNLWKYYPPQPMSQYKWYDYQMSKLQAYAANDFESNTLLFIIYLQQTAFNVLVSNIYRQTEMLSDNCLVNLSDTTATDKITDDAIHDDCNSSTMQTSPQISLIIPKEKNNSVIISNSKKLETINMLNNNGKSVCSMKSEQNELTELETYLKGKSNMEKKLNKLRSFLICPDLSHLYQELFNLQSNGQLVDKMKYFELLEDLDPKTMCQKLLRAFQTFLNVDFIYFAPTDSILLWFNNLVESNTRSSYTIETELGFRDFYEYKLKGKTHFEELAMENDLFLLTAKGSQKDKLRSGIPQESHNKTEHELPPVAYNLGPLQKEVTDISKGFFSEDSSYVKVKEIKYFHSKSSILVTINKNNTSLNYELNPEIARRYLKVLLRLYNDIIVNCQIEWKKKNSTEGNQNNIKAKERGEINEENQRSASILTLSSQVSIQSTTDLGILKDEHVTLDCTINVTLPTGLLIEVVPTDSVFGPFYIRQSYLSKGPSCSAIWEEVRRCYLNNGSVIIFRIDGSVDILYSNGTLVSCKSFESRNSNCIQEEEILVDLHEQEILSKEKKINKAVIKESKKGQKHDKKINEQIKKDFFLKTSNTENRSKVRNPVLISEENNQNLEAVEVENEDKILSEISQHSVFSWDGLYREFSKSNRTYSKRHNYLKWSFDHFNQQLYILRNDGLASLFTPEHLSVSFPDGSRITSCNEDGKVISLDGDDPTFNSEPRRTFEFQGDKLEKRESRSQTEHCISTNEHDLKQNVKESKEIEDFVFVETNYMIEHVNYATIIYKNSRTNVEIKVPGNVTIKINKDKLFHINVNKNSDITLFKDCLKFEANTLDKNHLKSTSTLQFENFDISPTIYCRTLDSFGTVFLVDSQGTTNLLRSKSDVKQPSSSCYSRHPENLERFFVFKRDLTGYEMTHKHHEKESRPTEGSSADVMEVPLIKNNYFSSVYKQAPIYKNKSEQYLMTFKEEKLLPKLIRKKNLSNMERDQSGLWFTPTISLVDEIQTGVSRPFNQIAKAIVFVKMLRMKNNDPEIFHSFVRVLQKYIEMNEQILMKYSNYYQKHNREQYDNKISKDKM